MPLHLIEFSTQANIASFCGCFLETVFFLTLGEWNVGHRNFQGSSFTVVFMICTVFVVDLRGR